MPGPAFSYIRDVPEKSSQKLKEPASSLVVIGSSTGGVPVVREILNSLREDAPAIVVAQHMPRDYTGSFAESCNMESLIYASEAGNGSRIYQGFAFIIPGDSHGVIHRDDNGLYVELNSDEPVNFFRPSVDVLFASAARVSGMPVTGIILTGMGSDGAKGLMMMREAGHETIAQDRESSAVYGMPREAAERGAARMIMTIGEMIAHINSMP
jgi:two-component system chemotaxis response regulator CheB